MGGVIGAFLVSEFFSTVIIDYFHEKSEFYSSSSDNTQDLRTSIVNLYVANLRNENEHIYEFSCNYYLKELPMLSARSKQKKINSEFYKRILDNIKWLQDNGHCKEINYDIESYLKDLNSDDGN